MSASPAWRGSNRNWALPRGQHLLFGIVRGDLGADVRRTGQKCARYLPQRDAAERAFRPAQHAAQHPADETPESIHARFLLLLPAKHSTSQGRGEAVSGGKREGWRGGRANRPRSGTRRWNRAAIRVILSMSLTLIQAEGNAMPATPAQSTHPLLLLLLITLPLAAWQTPPAAAALSAPRQETVNGRLVD